MIFCGSMVDLLYHPEGPDDFPWVSLKRFVANSHGRPKFRALEDPGFDFEFTGPGELGARGLLDPPVRG